MKPRVTLFFCSLMVLCGFCIPVIKSSNPDTRRLSVSLEEVGPSSLPLQAVRLRMKITNASNNRIEHLIPPENAYRIKSIVEPKVREGGALKGCTILDKESESISADLKTRGGRDREKLFLDPGESMSVSFPIVFNRRRTGAWQEGVANTVFSSPGDYTITCSVMQSINSPDKPTAQKVEYDACITVRIDDPHNGDRELCRIFQNNCKYVVALHVPAYHMDGSTAQAFEALIVKYPASSYSAYMRYALASYYYKIQGAEWKFNNIKAVKELRSILNAAFPYQPNAALLMVRIDKKLGGEALPVLHNMHYDAIEWLDEANKYLLINNWWEYRKHPSLLNMAKSKRSQ